MAKQIGIDQNSQQRIISGVRVTFDVRTTAEVDDTRDMTNRVYRSSKKRREALAARPRIQEAA